MVAVMVFSALLKGCDNFDALGGVAACSKVCPVVSCLQLLRVLVGALMAVPGLCLLNLKLYIVRSIHVADDRQLRLVYL